VFLLRKRTPSAASLPETEQPAPYDKRGWPNFERAAASLTKISVPWCWATVVDVENPAFIRVPPMTPDNFEELLNTLHFRNGKSDCDLVAGLYRKTVVGFFGHAEELRVIGAGWGDEEIVTFAKIFPLCTNVKAISLNMNKIGDQGAAALADAFKISGVLPNLTVRQLAQSLACCSPMVSTLLPLSCSVCSAAATR
jgi:hypothetical protein